MGHSDGGEYERGKLKDNDEEEKGLGLWGLECRLIDTGLPRSTF